MKTLRDFNFYNKRVILRVDFNEPLKNGEIVNDFKIQANLSTIRYLTDSKAKIILLSHLGRPMTSRQGTVSEEEREKFTLRPIAQYLSKLLNQEVGFVSACLGQEVERKIDALRPGQIIFLENLRFEPGEINNDKKFAERLSQLGELYINDAFADAHREHASIIGIPKYIPSLAGLLLQKEVEVLTGVLKNIRHPLVLIIGGVKVSTKLKFIKLFLEKVDELILGGALANVVIKARGWNTGQSIIAEEMSEEVRKIELTNVKIHIPVDVITSIDKSGAAPVHIAPVGMINEKEMILDIGPDTEELFTKVILKAKTVVWNGPMGFFESERFSSGTRKIAQAVSQCAGFTVVGGGETIACLDQLGLLEKINHISTGGGAMLMFLAGEKLPGIEVLK